MPGTPPSCSGSAGSYLVKPFSFDGLMEMVRSLHNYWLKLNETAEYRNKAKDILTSATASPAVAVRSLLKVRTLRDFLPGCITPPAIVSLNATTSGISSRRWD